MKNIVIVKCLNVINSENTIEESLSGRRFACIETVVDRRSYSIDDVECTVECKITTTVSYYHNGIDYQQEGSVQSVETKSYEIGFNTNKVHYTKLKPFLDRLVIMKEGEEVWCRATYTESGILACIDDMFVA